MIERRVKEYQYASALSRDIKDFIDFKASVGISSTTRNYTMLRFDAYCTENGVTSYSRGIVEDWVKQHRAEYPSGCHSWMSYIRDFGRFLQTTKDSNAYVLSDEFVSGTHHTIPYLMTQAEIEAFFAKASDYAPRSSWAWQTIPFFGLMHSCGLRTCEAQRLQSEHVNYKNRTIDIVLSKGKRSRRLAITDEITELLYRCNKITTSEFGSDRSAFFVNNLGNPLSSTAVGVAFKKVWNDADLPEVKCGKRVRPYDLRHHFAYANIERWRKEGISVEAMLPYLARYMGHASFDSTYYYVHTSPDFLSDYVSLQLDCSNVLPEVGFDA